MDYRKGDSFISRYAMRELINEMDEQGSLWLDGFSLSRLQSILIRAQEAARTRKGAGATEGVFIGNDDMVQAIIEERGAK